MAISIRITAKDIKVKAALNDSATARAIAEILPIQAEASRWGKEIYFSIPVKHPLEEDARQVVRAGELGYWPSGDAFCMFFGPTPASQGDEIRAASPVNIIGTFTADFEQLDSVPDGATVRIEKA